MIDDNAFSSKYCYINTKELIADKIRHKPDLQKDLLYIGMYAMIGPLVHKYRHIL